MAEGLPLLSTSLALASSGLTRTSGIWMLPPPVALTCARSLSDKSEPRVSSLTMSTAWFDPSAVLTDWESPDPCDMLCALWVTDALSWFETLSDAVDKLGPERCESGP